jgi:hypothetical protein
MSQGNASVENGFLARMRAAKGAAVPPAINPPEYQPPPVSAEARDAGPGKPSTYVTTGVPASGVPVSAPILSDAASRTIPMPAVFASATPAPFAEPNLPPMDAVAPVLHSAVVEAAVKRGPGRPKKAPAAPPVVASAAMAEAMAAHPAPVDAPADAVAASWKKIGTLFVDCGPVGVACTDAYTLILAGKTRLAAAGVEDYRLVKFGEGAGQLAVAVGKELDAQLGHLPYVRIDSHSPEGNVCLSVFIDRAQMVVR